MVTSEADVVTRAMQESTYTMLGDFLPHTNFKKAMAEDGVSAGEPQQRMLKSEFITIW